MGVEDELDFLAEVHGNIEISFNKTSSELDPYEAVSKQVVLAIGKTGRANRLTINGENLKASQLKELANTLEDISEQMSKIEGYEELEMEDIEENLTDTEELVLTEIKTAQQQSEDGDVEIDSLKELVELRADEDQTFKEAVSSLKRRGELFEPREGYIQYI